jgi:hypothetical protein
MAARRLLAFGLLLALLTTSLAFAAANPAPAFANPVDLPTAPVHSLLHIATAANIDAAHSNVTYLNDPILNGTFGGDYVLWVTSNWNPRGYNAGGYNNHPIGVWYNTSLHRWAIVNQDGAAIPVGAAFNVMFAYGNPNAFCHPTQAGSVSGNYSVITASQLNNNPGAILILTPMAYGGTAPGTLHNHNVGVAYDAPSGRWRVYNEDGAAMDTGRSFCGLVVSFYRNSWITTVNTDVVGGNAIGNYVVLESAATNRNPYSMVFVTHNLGPTNGLFYTNHPLGVWYTSAYGGRWSVFTQDIANVVKFDYFNIFAIEVKATYIPAVRR